MATAVNYLKARFASSEAAARALPELRALVQQGVQAHAFWQAHRHLERQGRRDEFWHQFRNRFPQITVCLGALVDGCCNEALLGFLEFGQPDSTELYA